MKKNSGEKGDNRRKISDRFRNIVEVFESGESEVCQRARAHHPGQKSSEENRHQKLPRNDNSAKTSGNFQDILTMFRKITNQKKEQNLKLKFPKICLQTVQKGKINATSSTSENKAHPSLSPGTPTHHPPQDQLRGGLRKNKTKCQPNSKLPSEFKFKLIQTYFKPTTLGCKLAYRLEESDTLDPDEPSSPKQAQTRK